MSLYVVDSSVVIKWFTQEVNSAEAVRLQTCGTPLHAPDFLDVELAAIAWKKMRRDGMPRADADFIVSQLPTVAVTRHQPVPSTTKRSSDPRKGSYHHLWRLTFVTMQKDRNRRNRHESYRCACEGRP